MPFWVKNPPKSEHPDEYKYDVAIGTGRSENEARLDAQEQMVKQVFMASGCTSENQIEYYQADGFRVRTENSKSYIMNDKEGTFYYYQLYIYATEPRKFKQQHFECEKGEEKPDLTQIKTPTTRPLYWSNYDDTKSYLTQHKIHTLEKSQVLQNIIDSLSLIAEQSLVNKYKEYGADELFPPLVCFDNYYDKKAKEVHVIAYVKKKNLKNLYVNLISESLTVTIENEIKDAQSYEKTADWEIATATYKKAQEQCDKTASMVAQLKAITGESPLVMYYTGEINKAREVLRTGLAALRKKAAPDREKRLRELLDIAQKAEKERKLGTVLKYYYGALAYMNRFPQAGSLTVNYDYAAMGRPWGTKITNTSTNHVLKDWLPEHIRKILSGIQVHCYRDDSDVIKQNFIFTWPDNTLVTNGDFCFNLNKGEGWSWLYDITNGEGEIEKRDCPKQFDIQFEYKYIEQWHSDEAIRNEVKNAVMDFGAQAIHHITVEGSKPKSAPSTGQGKTFPSTDAKMSYAKSAKNSLQQVSVSEENVYKDVIAKVCDAINTRDYTSIKNSFTQKGYKLFLNFVEGGKVTVKNATRYSLISCWDEVYARSIKMDIRYQSKKGVMTKNVVFVFDKDKKIDGLQFAIDEVTRQDINAQDNWNDEMKYAVMNFIENYQTAYNLKRLDYIESVFSDDAVIIVGQVLPVTKLNDSGNINFNDGKSQKVKYYNLSKDEYVKRLKRVFGTNEWIDINFANIDISQHPDMDVKSVYGLGMRQDYSSQHYGDTGYLFLVVDMNDQQKPVIHLRVWTPEAEFGWPQYLQLLKEEQEARK